MIGCKILYELEKNSILDQKTKLFTLSSTGNKITLSYIKNREWFDYDIVDTLKNAFIKGDEILDIENFKVKPNTIILSTSGMINEAYSLQLLPKLIDKKMFCFYLLGYQSKSTYGGKIIDHQKQIDINNKTYDVNLKFQVFHNFSGHGDAKDVDHWLKNNKNSTIFLVHGSKDRLEERKKDLLKKGFKRVFIVKKHKRMTF